MKSTSSARSGVTVMADTERSAVPLFTKVKRSVTFVVVMNVQVTSSFSQIALEIAGSRPV
jgi:hypothetical protein